MAVSIPWFLQPCGNLAARLWWTTLYRVAARLQQACMGMQGSLPFRHGQIPARSCLVSQSCCWASILTDPCNDLDWQSLDIIIWGIVSNGHIEVPGHAIIVQWPCLASCHVCGYMSTSVIWSTMVVAIHWSRDAQSLHPCLSGHWIGSGLIITPNYFPHHYYRVTGTEAWLVVQLVITVMH